MFQSPSSTQLRYSSPLAGFQFQHQKTMDWQGQKLAEQLMQIMLLITAAAAFITGYILASFQMMIIIYSSGVVLTAFTIIPNWPCFNRHPLNWLDSADAERHPKPHSATVSSKKKSSKNK